MAVTIHKSEESYKILGVDPGTNILGYAVLEVTGKNLKVLNFGVFHLEKYEDHHEKLKEIFLQLQEIIESYLPKQLAIEAPFYGKNVQSMLKLGRAQGVAMAAAMTMGLEIQEYAPKKIKQSITGNGNASKEQVAAMLQTLLTLKELPKKMDATDGLAAAVCHFFQQNTSGGSKKKLSGGWKSFLTENPERLLKR